MEISTLEFLNRIPHENSLKVDDMTDKLVIESNFIFGLIHREFDDLLKLPLYINIIEKATSWKTLH